MKTIKTQVEDEIYKVLVKMRKKAGLPSISALFLQKCALLTNKAEANEIFKRALSEAKKFDAGTEFTVKQLFDTKTWTIFSKGGRISAGRQFFAHVSSARDGIRPTSKTATNHQLYIRSE